MSQRSPFNKRNLPTEPEAKPERTSLGRKSAASAKPAREAASSVRVVKTTKDNLGNKQTTGLTKEEKKAQRKAEREEDDKVFAISNMVLKHNELYKKRRRLWWAFMIVGIVFIFASFALGYLSGTYGASGNDYNATMGNITIACLVIAYIGIFGALIWDFAKIRPIRNETQQEVASMSEKRRLKLVEECDAMDAAKKAGKSSAKDSASTK